MAFRDMRIYGRNITKHCALSLFPAEEQGRPELPIGPISVDLDTFDPIITI